MVIYLAQLYQTILTKENTNMKKMYITESDLHDIVKESVNKILTEFVNDVVPETPAVAPAEAPATTNVQKLTWSPKKFIQSLHQFKNAICGKPGGCSKCTAVINRALQAAGFGDKYWSTLPQQVYAKIKSRNSDFIEVNHGVTPSNKEFSMGNIQPGDICLMWSIPNKDIHYHACAFDGKHWVSDFVQNNCNVYTGKKPLCKMEWHVFRHK